MAKREDGRETKLRLLNAACDIFSRKGFRDAKVAEICKQAGANVASVNYYFGDKANLYREAFLHAITGFKERVFDEIDENRPPEELLRDYIETLMRHFATKGELARFSRLYLREMVNPTGLIQDAWHDSIQPRRSRLHEIIRGIIGGKADEQTVLFCELSIINQCRTLVTIKASDLQYMLGRPLTPELVRSLSAHVLAFSLAGIRAVGGCNEPPGPSGKKSGASGKTR